MADLEVVKVKKLVSDAQAPSRATNGSSGYDLYALEDFTLYVNQSIIARTGIALEIPAGYEGQIRPRSGLAGKYGVTVLNTPGTIDSDYRGEILVCLYNSGDYYHNFVKGEKIAQIVFCKVEAPEFELVSELSNTDRADGGFGSTDEAPKKRRAKKEDTVGLADGIKDI